MGVSKLPRINSGEDLRAVLAQMIQRIEKGETAEQVLSNDDMKRIARSVADLSKGEQTLMPQGGRVTSVTSTPRSLPELSRGGRGAGPEPRRPTFRSLIKR